MARAYNLRGDFKFVIQVLFATYNMSECIRPYYSTDCIKTVLSHDPLYACTKRAAV